MKYPKLSTLVSISKVNRLQRCSGTWMDSMQSYGSGLPPEDVESSKKYGRRSYELDNLPMTSDDYFFSTMEVEVWILESGINLPQSIKSNDYHGSILSLLFMYGVFWAD